MAQSKLLKPSGMWTSIIISVLVRIITPLTSTPLIIMIEAVPRISAFLRCGCGFNFIIKISAVRVLTIQFSFVE